MSPLALAAEVAARLPAAAAEAAGHGFHVVSPWWLSTLTRWLLSDCRQLVIRAGRRAGKSSTLCLLAVLWVMCFDDSQIPLGDVGVVAIVSVHRGDSESKMRTIQALLTAFGIKHHRTGDSIELHHRPIRFSVYSASISGVSGFTSILVICDEVSKWRDVDSGSNPATEVLSSIRPTTATIPSARIILSSSPLSTVDAHFQAFEAGDSAYQLTARATTWEANPSITEAQTHELEPDKRVWSREYAALPADALASAFDSDDIEAAIGADVPAGDMGPLVLIVDASDARAGGDPFTACTARWIHPTEIEGEAKRPPVFSFGPIVSYESGGHRFDTIVHQLSEHARKLGVVAIFGDQRENFALQAAFSGFGFHFTSLAWTNQNKIAAVTRVRRLLSERSILLPADEKLRRELAGFSEKILPSGAITFGARSRQHDDRVALLLTAAIADAEGMIGMSPVERTTPIVTCRVFSPDPKVVEERRRQSPHHHLFRIGPHELRSGRRHLN